MFLHNFGSTEAYSQEKILLVPLALDLLNYSSVLNQEDKSRFISLRTGRVVVLTIAEIIRGKT